MQETLGRLVAILHRRNTAYLNQVLKPYQITSAEVGILRTLYRKEDRTQEELASILSIDKAAIARAVRTLEKKEYLVRISDPVDRRCNRLFLTERAKTLQAEIEPAIDAWNQHAREELGAEAYELLCTTLYSLLSTDNKEPS